MQTKHLPLPPLNALLAFEAAARHQSFTLAARELNVTQGAVSRQVRQLEDWLGAPLFQRAHRRIRLTATGSHYQQVAAAALGQIAQASRGIRSRSRQTRITVGATLAMASFWLLPRLSRFRRVHPDLEIRILASDRDAEVEAAEVDLAIRYARYRPAGGRSVRLFAEEIFPVCSPEYLRGRTPLAGAVALAGETLLDLEDEHPDWVDWAEWFRRAGVRPPREEHGIRINNYPMLVQAALNGEGIALGWRHMVDAYLDSGALLRPVDTVVTSAGGFWLLEPEQGVAKAGAQALRDFLLEAVEGEKQ